MRKLIVGLLAAAWVGAWVSVAADTKEMWNDEFGGFYQSSDEILPGMGKKAVRGAINLVTGIVEWPMQTYKGWQNGLGFIKNKPTSKTVGALIGFFFSGPGQFAAREVWGGTELFGFWTANRPENLKPGVPKPANIGVPFDAQYSWQMGKKYDMFSPTLKDGLRPYGRKLMYGLADGFVGIAELPGQIVKGVKEDNIGAGVCKGVWFWWSREVYGMFGMGAVFGCLVSNPEDNPGYAYEGEWPWSDLLDSLEK